MKRDTIKPEHILPVTMTVLAYVALLLLPVMVEPSASQILIAGSCSAVACITMLRLIQTGPIWKQAVALVSVLPLGGYIFLIIWPVLRGS